MRESTHTSQRVSAPLDATSLDALQLLLLVELLQADLYARGVASLGLIPATDLPVFTAIGEHESTHVSTIRSLITSGGGAPAAPPVFDFTVKGNFPGFAFAAGQYTTFTSLAHMIEDLAVRAYTGQLPRLVTDKTVLTSAMRIHSVESRHAAEVRRLRGRKGWITSNSRDDLPAFAQPIYDGEDNVIQNGVSVATIAASAGGAPTATEAFDEPLTKDQVTPIVTLFIAQ